MERPKYHYIKEDLDNPYHSDVKYLQDCINKILEFYNFLFNECMLTFKFDEFDVILGSEFEYLISDFADLIKQAVAVE